MPHPRLLLAFALPATLTVNARAAELVRPEPPHVHATRLSQAPVIDGKLDEPLWKDAAIITDFKQIKPGDGTPVSERTSVRAGRQGQSLHRRPHDRPPRPRRHHRQRDEAGFAPAR
ncbi:MAG: hypothetical protein IPH71_05880 [Proteobacteria bacterium]|nr:hypothetical protein [Pseudomonadota bacterium]